MNYFWHDFISLFFSPSLCPGFSFAFELSESPLPPPPQLLFPLCVRIFNPGFYIYFCKIKQLLATRCKQFDHLIQHSHFKMLSVFTAFLHERVVRKFFLSSIRAVPYIIRVKSISELP